MKILAISGSMRLNSTNTLLLETLAECAIPILNIEIAKGLDKFPIFSPDLEGSNTPQIIDAFATSVANSAGILISSPEYVRAIPGGLKNAIDWLVSREELISKPVALVHASHRGDDMLDSLRHVLNTVSGNFCSTSFLRIPLTPSHSMNDMRETIMQSENKIQIDEFVRTFSEFVQLNSSPTTTDQNP